MEFRDSKFCREPRFRAEVENNIFAESRFGVKVEKDILTPNPCFFSTSS